MSLQKKIFYNTLAATIGKIAAVAIGLVTIGIQTRYLGEHGFGQYATVLAVLGLAVVLSDLGLYLFVVREISKPGADNRRIISNALGLRLVAGLMALFGGAVFALFLPYDPEVKNTIFLGILAFEFVTLNQVLFGIFQKHLVQHFPVIAELAGRLISLALILSFIRHSLTVPLVIGALTAANGTIFLLTYLFARRYESFGFGFDRGAWAEILKKSWPLAFAVVLNLIYFKTDTIILSLYYPQNIVGIYSLPYKVLEVLLAFPHMFVGLVMPVLSREAHAGAWDKFRDVLQRGFDTLLLVALAMIIITQFYAEQIIDLIKGKESYAASPGILQILIFATGIIFLGTLFGYAVVAVQKQKAMIWGYLTGAIGGLALYFFLIPRFGYYGAASGTIAVELVVTLFAYILVRRTTGQGVSLNILLRALPAALTMILFFRFISFHWLLEIAAGFALYIGLLVLFRAVPWEFVSEITRRGKQSAG